MKEAIASTYLYNIIFVFLAVVFAFVMGSMIYYKSMKVNKIIISSIEKYEGYNEFSKTEISQSLTSIGYGVAADGKGCPIRKGIKAEAKDDDDGRMYCVYLLKNDTTDGSNNYYSYGVITYITLNFPFADIFLRVPIYSESNRIFRFTR